MMRTIHCTAILLCTALAAGAQDHFWNRSTGPFGASVRALASIGARTLAATENGLYLSDDDGRRWRSAGIALEDIFLVSMAVRDDGTVVVALNGGGLRRSTDGGDTWSALAPIPAAANDLSFARDGALYAATRASLLKSTDAGTTWQHIPELGELTSVHAGVGTSDAPSGAVFTGGPGFLHLSTDDGVTWATHAAPLAEATMQSVTEAAGGDLIATFRAYGPGGLYRSSDGGATWRSLDLLAVPYATHVVSANGTIIAASAVGVWRSSDGGATWEAEAHGPFRGFDIRSFAVTRGGAILGGAAFGIYRSTDDGVSWSAAMEGMSAGWGNDVAVLPGGEIVADVGGAVHRSSDLGASWHMTPFRAFLHRIFPVGNSTLVLVSGAIAATERFEEPFTQESIRASVNAQEIVRIDDATYVAASIASAALFRSVDSGATWTQLPHPFTTYGLNALAVARSGELYAFGDSRLSRSTDVGDSWTTVVESVGSSNDAAMHVATDGSILVGSSIGLLYRIDPVAGTSTRIGRDLGAIESILETAEGVIYLATADNGALRSRDNGTMWEHLTAPQRIHSFRAFALHPSGYLFANTHGGSILRSAEPVTTFRSAAPGERELPLRMDLSLDAPR